MHFYFAAMNAGRSHEKAVCPSVCLSNARIVTKQKKVLTQIFVPYERSFSLVVWEEKWLKGGDPFYMKLWVNRPPLERKRRFSDDIRA